MIAKVGEGGSLLQALGHDDGCVPRGVVSGGDVNSVVVRRCYYIGRVQRSGGNAVICFCIPAQTKGAAYSVGGGALCCFRWRRRKGKFVQIVKRCNIERSGDKRKSWHHSCWCTRKQYQSSRHYHMTIMFALFFCEFFFVRAGFLWNLKKIGTFLTDQT